MFCECGYDVEKVEALSEERDRLHNEREDFKSKNDELVDEVKFLQATGAGGAGTAASQTQRPWRRSRRR